MKVSGNKTAFRATYKNGLTWGNDVGLRVWDHGTCGAPSEPSEPHNEVGREWHRELTVCNTGVKTLLYCPVSVSYAVKSSPTSS